MLDQGIYKYQQKFSQQHGYPSVFYAKTKIQVHNMPDSAKRHPQGNIGWINYWRAFSGISRDFVRCSRCGKELSVHKELKTLHEAFAKYCPGCCNYEYAEGGHVIVENVQGIEDGIYITPLCVDCNNKFNQDIDLLPASVMVEELEPVIDE